MPPSSGAAPSSSEPPTVSFGEWSFISTSGLLKKRHEACFVAVGDKAYLIGGRGLLPVTEFVPFNQTWNKKSKPPVELNHMQCVAVDEKIWIMSAWTGNYPNETAVADIYIYDPSMDSWAIKTGLPENRRRGGAAAVFVDRNGTREIYVSHGNRGGHGAHAQALGWLDKYNVDTDTWTTNLTDAPNPRDHTGGALVNGNRICVAGGRDGGEAAFFNTTVAPTDCFNLDTGLWESKAPIPTPRAGSAYGTTCDGKLMVAGGEGYGQAWANVEVFDGDVWDVWNPLNEARHGTGLAVFCGCNEIYIASGSGDQGGFPELSTTERYVPSGSVC